MDADGVDMQVLSPTPLFFAYRRPVDHGVKAAAVFNDIALEICAPAPDRLVPFCQVPLQDPDAACRELDRCMPTVTWASRSATTSRTATRRRGHRHVPSALRGGAGAGVRAPLGDGPITTTEPLDGALAGGDARRDAPLVAGHDPGGVFDRVSDSLRICFAHGGGSFAFWLGRTDNAWHRRPDLVATSEHPPSHYVRRVHVDSVVFTEAALRVLVDTFGVDRVMLGSDYPFPLGERPAGQVIRTGWLPHRARPA
jgi:aminocarboxymuconate-semialdehyde decarboxylase